MTDQILLEQAWASPKINTTRVKEQTIIQPGNWGLVTLSKLAITNRKF
jgi:hypothetical protein